MPRYQIDDAAMAELIAYLKGMTVVRARSERFGAALCNHHHPDADPVNAAACST